MNKKIDREPRVRVVTSGGAFVCWRPHSEINRGIQTGRYRVKSKTRKRYLCVVDTAAGISANLPLGTPLHYREKLSDVFSLVTLKRLLPDGRFERYDQGLTFAELRAGQIVSSETMAARAAA